MKRLILTAFLLSFFYLQSFSQSNLVFCYDTAGNQSARGYDNGQLASNFCAAHRIPQNNNEITKNSSEEKIDIIEESSLEELFTLFPNPTSGNVKLSWQEEVQDKIFSIELVGMSNPYYRDMKFYKETVWIETDITKEYTGMYIFKITLNDGNIVYKKLVKQ